MFAHRKRKFIHIARAFVVTTPPERSASHFELEFEVLKLGIDYRLTKPGARLLRKQFVVEL
jgi:hypothetical protein